MPVPAKEGAGVASVENVDKTLIVTTALDGVGANFDLFVEGPEDWFLPPPEKAGSDGTSAKWRIPLEWIPKSATIEGTELRFTLVGDKSAVEQTWRLD